MLFRSVRQALTAERGWARVRKDEACDLRWTYDERAIPFDALRDHQMANHYRDIRCLTTKAGLTRTLDEELPWCASTDAACFFPRSHALDTDRELELVKMTHADGRDSKLKDPTAPPTKGTDLLNSGETLSPELALKMARNGHLAAFSGDRKSVV